MPCEKLFTRSLSSDVRVTQDSEDDEGSEPEGPGLAYLYVRGM